MLKYKDVSPDRQIQLNDSKDIIRHRLERAEKLPRDLLDRLDRYLDDNMQVKVVEVYIDVPKEVPHWGEARGFCVHLQPWTFAPWEKTGKPRLTAVLYHMVDDLPALFFVHRIGMAAVNTRVKGLTLNLHGLPQDKLARAEIP